MICDPRPRSHRWFEPEPPTLSTILQEASEACLDAAHYVEYLLQGKQAERSARQRLEKLTSVLEKALHAHEDMLFFANFLKERATDGEATDADVHREICRAIGLLRTIETFDRGAPADLRWAKKFCLDLHEALLAACRPPEKVY